MPPACLRHDQLPHSSRLFTDYLYHFDRVARFYPRPSGAFLEAARQIEYPAARRAAMIEALRAQNGEHPALEVLARPNAVAVVTGQQVGLFSGPCYTVFKAITAALLARQITAAGVPAAPVFWLATEDHDFAEVNHCWVFDAAHRPVRLEVNGAAPANQPVGGIVVEKPPIAELRAALNEFPFCDEVVDLVERAYQPGRTMGAAFADLIRSVLAPLGLLLLDPLQPAIRRLAAPLLSEAALAAPRLSTRLLARGRELTDAGYHTQVHVDSQTSLLFLLEGDRRVSLRRDGEFHAGEGKRYTAGDLASRAERLSPNALLRPVVQDFMLPTAAYVGGPAELAYFAQSAVIYDELKRPMPAAASRQFATLLDARSAGILDKYELKLTDCLEGEEALRERIAQRLVPPEVAAAVARAKGTAASAFDELGSALTRFDPTLEAAFAKSRRKIEWQLTKTERKTARAALAREERAAAAAASLSGLVYPQKKLQERFYTILPFLARHGLDLIERLAGELSPDCPDHRIVTL